MPDINRKDVLTRAYEDLRDFSVNHKMPLTSPRGLALFLHRGMSGWIEVWSRPVSSDQTVTVKSQSIETHPGDSGNLPPEAAAILANMALAAIGRNNS
jgi:hypothetical protein